MTTLLDDDYQFDLISSALQPFGFRAAFNYQKIRSPGLPIVTWATGKALKADINIVKNKIPSRGGNN